MTDYMSIEELEKATGMSSKSIKYRLNRERIRHIVVDGKWVYPVTPDLLRPKWTKKDGMQTHEGLLDGKEIAARAGVSYQHVLHTLEKKGIAPAAISATGAMLWEDREEIIKAVKVGLKQYQPKHKKTDPRTLGEAGELLAEEKRKKAWVGLQGRIVIDGKTTYTGRIEHVSCTGCFVNERRCSLRELELAN